MKKICFNNRGLLWYYCTIKFLLSLNIQNRKGCTDFLFWPAGCFQVVLADFFCLSSGLVHDSLPFILPLALPRRLHASVQWQRPAHAALGPGVQVSIFPSHNRHIIIVLTALNSMFHHFHSKFDLYTKTTDLPDVEKLKVYYQSLIDKYCPGILRWWKLWSCFRVTLKLYMHIIHHWI